MTDPTAALRARLEATAEYMTEAPEQIATDSALWRDAIALLRDAAQALASHGERWAPIESAPKDGTWILAIRVAAGQPVGLHDVLRWSHPELLDHWSDGEYTFCPTHWQPLPPPPTPRQE